MNRKWTSCASILGSGHASKKIITKVKIFKYLTIITLLTINCKKYELQNGDIIFQSSTSNQSKAVELATRSPYSHMGIIYIKDNKPYVYEASNVVKLTEFKTWVKRGKKSKYEIKRLKNAKGLLNNKHMEKLYEAGMKYRGKLYDLYFEWSDDRIYCSELVWKIYKDALGIEIGTLTCLKDFDLTSNEVRKKLAERYGNSIPENELVISPDNMYTSDLLRLIYKN
jgi:hypothetical protein